MCRPPNPVVSMTSPGGIPGRECSPTSTKSACTGREGFPPSLAWSWPVGLAVQKILGEMSARSSGRSVSWVRWIDGRPT